MPYRRPHRHHFPSHRNGERNEQEVHGSLCLWPGDVRVRYRADLHRELSLHGLQASVRRRDDNMVVVPETDFTVLSGSTKSFSYGPNTETCADQGLDRVFCTNCGSRVFTNNLKRLPWHGFRAGRHSRSPRRVVRPEERDLHVEPPGMGTAGRRPTVRPRALVDRSLQWRARYARFRGIARSARCRSAGPQGRDR